MLRGSLLAAFFSVALNLPCAVLAQQAHVFDCVRFAENGNDVIVDRACLISGLKGGADPNWINRETKQHMSTLSHYVELISISRDPKVSADGAQAIQALINAGAKLQPIDAAILFWPVSQGNTALVRLLLSLGVSASAWPNDEIGTTLSPVEKAATEGHDEIVNLLVKHGAASPSSKTVLQERFVRSASFGSIEELAALVSRGASLNGKSRDDQTALINALWSVGVSDCKTLLKVRWLLENGADANLDGTGPLMHGTAPPLHQAVWVTGLVVEAKGESVCAGQILRELIKRGARIAARDSSGRTPLHIAAERNHMAAARLLLESGSTVMPRDKKGRTPLEIAESSEMIKLLKQHGATER